MLDETDRKRSSETIDVAQDVARARSAAEGAGRPAEGGALVHRDLRNPPAWSEAGQNLRVLRFSRRQRSSGWLIGQAREAAGLERDSGGPDTSATEIGWVRPERVARCRWRISSSVGVHGGPAQSAHFSGLERCGSVWACPVCSAVIRARRAQEIQRAVEQHQAAGGHVLFVTATLRHTVADELATTLNAALEGWRRTFRGAPWTRWRERLGWVGTIRSVEVTWGAANGWHPHVHALLFLDARPGDDTRAAFESWLFARWSQSVVNLGAGMPSRERGLDMADVDQNGRMVAAYLGKVQDEGAKRSTIGSELARIDMKVGRLDRLAPFQLLDAQDGVALARDLWCEYVAVVKGRKAITWTKGLKSRFQLDEVTDDEIIEDAQSSDHLADIPGETWDSNMRSQPRRMAAVLDAVEQDETAIRALKIVSAEEDDPGIYVDAGTGEVLTRDSFIDQSEFWEPPRISMAVLAPPERLALE